MSETRVYKREDYGHTLTEPIGDEVAAVGDLSTATAELRVYDRGNIFLSKTASVDSDAQECSYTWQDTDLPNAGEYQAEFFVTFSGGDRQRVPRVGWIPIIVEEIDATDAQDPAPPPVFDDHIEDTANPHDTTATQTGAIPTSEKGAAGGVVPLDADGNLTMPLNDRVRLRTDQDTATDERLIELKYTTDTAKAIIAYVDQNDNPVAWLQAHDYLSRDPDDRHRHFSIETARADGTLHTRLQVPYGTDTVDVEVNNANLVVGGTGEFTISDGNANINGDVLINEGNMRVNSTGTATLEVDRGGTSNYANLSFRSGGTEKFAVGLRAGDSHLHIRNSGVTKIRVRDGASGSIELGTGLDLQGNVIDGRAVRTLVGSGSLGTDDEWLLVDTSGGNASIALPQPASSQSFRLKKTTTDTNTVTLTRFGTEDVEGAASDHTLTGSGGTDRPDWTLVYDQPNNAWWVGS